MQEVGSDGGSNKLVIDTSRDNSVVSGGIGGTVDEVDNVVIKKSEPLLITTQPINDKASIRYFPSQILYMKFQLKNLKLGVRCFRD